MLRSFQSFPNGSVFRDRNRIGDLMYLKVRSTSRVSL